MVKRTGNAGNNFIAAIFSISCCLLIAGNAQAHCDTFSGPIIPEAQAALEKGDLTPVLKWVQTEDEAEIRSAFAKALAVRSKGKDAKELADRYFLETLVRVHRTSEGAPYSGIKDEAVDPVIAMAEKTLTSGSADKMIAMISSHMAEAIREKFEHALETRKRKDNSVEAGREFVAAYVTYMHYVEGIHAAIAASESHNH